jgi:hypothetical protein
VVRDGFRHCDICEETIPEGQRYAIAIISPHEIEIARSLLESEGTLDLSGNLRFDLCADCRMGMTLGRIETAT